MFVLVISFSFYSCSYSSLHFVCDNILFFLPFLDCFFSFVFFRRRESTSNQKYWILSQDTLWQTFNVRLMIFLTIEHANTAEINILSARYSKAWVLGPTVMDNNAVAHVISSTPQNQPSDLVYTKFILV